MDKINAPTLKEILVKQPNKIALIYLTSNNANILANSVVVVKDEKAYVFDSSNIVDIGHSALCQNVSTETLTDIVIPNACKTIKFSSESDSARLSILQMQIERVQKIKNSCSIKNGKRK